MWHPSWLNPFDQGLSPGLVEGLQAVKSDVPGGVGGVPRHYLSKVVGKGQVVTGIHV